MHSAPVIARGAFVIQLQQMGVRMLGFLICSLFPLFAIFLGIKALTPAGIELWDGKKLPPKVSIAIGLATIMVSVAVIAFLYAYCVLGIPRF